MRGICEVSGDIVLLLTGSNSVLHYCNVGLHEGYKVVRYQRCDPLPLI